MIGWRQSTGESTPEWPMTSQAINQPMSARLAVCLRISEPQWMPQRDCITTISPPPPPPSLPPSPTINRSINPTHSMIHLLQGGLGLGQTLAPPTAMSLMQRPPSSTDHLSPSGHLTPTGKHRIHPSIHHNSSISTLDPVTSIPGSMGSFWPLHLIHFNLNNNNNNNTYFWIKIYLLIGYDW